MNAKKPDLDAAYDLRTPQDSERLYADWAETYEDDFARRMAYRLPNLVADGFAQGGQGPVLDVGAGTGLVGLALTERGIGPIDGIDISEEMLAIARNKGVYRSLMRADLTQPLGLPAGSYNGVISAGTFTHGHVGPDALNSLLRIAAPQALFVFSVNEGVYEAGGFAAKLAELTPQISGLRLDREEIYAPAPNDDDHTNGQKDHQADRALIVRFRKV